jgi:hypothetical protein
MGWFYMPGDKEAVNARLLGIPLAFLLFPVMYLSSRILDDSVNALPYILMLAGYIFCIGLGWWRLRTFLRKRNKVARRKRLAELGILDWVEETEAAQRGETRNGGSPLRQTKDSPGDSDSAAGPLDP